MGRYLLAAEADKIQDFVFRSSRLKEVVGGSQLLTRFCKEVPKILLGRTDDIVIQDAGSFRILFDCPKEAKEFGKKLAEVYYRATEGSLTVAEPVEIKDNFGVAAGKADEALRQAKMDRSGWREQEHLPFAAFCDSCGTGLAAALQPDEEGGELRYLCPCCLRKRAEQAKGLGDFLNSFFDKITRKNPGELDYPGKGANDPTQDVAACDPRGYVSDLLDDGYDMGRIFGRCKDERQMRRLSQGLREVMREALAAPTEKIYYTNPLPGREGMIPVLPLIIGGDDLFALIPAPWALDFAGCFCRAYEEKMAALMKNIGLPEVHPTISAAVVICKSKYPYKSAYRVGLRRLKEAKEIGKEKGLSMVNFELIQGGVDPEEPGDRVRPTLRPYFVGEEEIPNYALPLKRLLEYRLKLRTIPNSRLSELQELYDFYALPSSDSKEELTSWKKKPDRLLERVRRKDEEQAGLIADSLAHLGQIKEKELGWWYQIECYQGNYFGHALPDLLTIWDFALRLEEPRQTYYEEG
ncbi:MAG: hypothetical protein GX493_01525 [Firmicutes bacterium]|nr:hypothetical protein [Bacillota bacterium]